MVDIKYDVTVIAKLCLICVQNVACGKVFVNYYNILRGRNNLQ